MSTTHNRFRAKNGLDNNSKTIINVADPINVTDAANKEYVDYLASFRNKLVNGDFTRWSRGNGTSVHGGYLADQWACPLYQSSLRTRQVGSSSGDLTVGVPQYVMRVAGDGTNSIYLSAGQPLEQAHTIPLRGQNVTFSGYIRCSAATFSVGGSISIGIGYTNGTADASYVTTNYSANGGNSTSLSSGSLPTTWKKFSVTCAISASANNIHVVVNATPLVYGAGDWYELALCQLNVGSVALPYEYRPSSIENVLCSRYIEVLSASNGRQHICHFAGLNTTTGMGLLRYAEKRIGPTITTSGTFRMLGYNHGSAVTLAFSDTSTTSCNVTGTGAFAAGYGCYAQTDDSATGKVFISAEL